MSVWIRVLLAACVIVLGNRIAVEAQGGAPVQGAQTQPRSEAERKRQEGEEQTKRRQEDATERKEQADRDRAQAQQQRPATAAECAISKQPVVVDVDRYGALVSLFGTQDQPVYVDSSLEVRLTGEAEGLFARPVPPPESKLDSKPLSLSIKEPAKFERADLLPLAQGGLVKVQIESTPKGATTPVVLSTIWTIPYTPWTVVLNESGPIDPRFRGSAAPVHFTCDPVLLFSPSTPALQAPIELAPPGIGAAGMTLKPQECRLLKWPPPAGRRQTQAPPATANPDKCGEATLAPFLRDDQAQIIMIRNNRGVAVVALTRGDQETFREAPWSDENVDGVPSRIFPILLDRTGVASWQYLNRRRPPELRFTTANAYLRFRSNIPDRQFIVTFSGIPDTERAELIRHGVDVTNCRDGKCQTSIVVPAGGAGVRFPLVPLKNAFAKSGSLVTFQVAFFDEDTTPTNSRGYFTLVPYSQFVEPGSSTTWSGGASATYHREPDMTGMPFTPKGQKSPALSFSAPWEGVYRSRVAGSATLNARQTLGTRADMEIELIARKADFGSDATNVQATKYLANAYAVYALTLTAGRFDLAAPTSGIALSESGEAINGSYLLPKNVVLSIGRIFKKEMSFGGFTLDEEQKAVNGGSTFLEKDHETTLLQVRDLFAVKRFRLSLFGVMGDADRGEHFTSDATTTPPTLALAPYDVDYWTAGADMVLGVKNVFFSGGLYHSRKSETRPIELAQHDDVSGNAALLSVSLTNPDSKIVNNKQGIDWVLTGLIGAGGEYVGESQAFTPDVLFLSTFAASLREPSVAIGRGLTNKLYFGGIWTTPQFGWIKSLADKVPFLANDINSSNLTFKLHHYRLRNAGDDRGSNLGTEGSVEFRLESPKGVRYQFTFAGFEPGGALDTDYGVNALIRKFQYVVRLGVTIRFD